MMLRIFLPYGPFVYDESERYNPTVREPEWIYYGRFMFEFADDTWEKLLNDFGFDVMLPLEVD